MKIARKVAEFSKPTGSVWEGDALSFLRQQERGSASIVFLDPPFNLGKWYGASKINDLMENEVYREWMRAVLSESARIIADGGALFLYHLPSWAIEFAGELSKTLTFRHWIAVSMKNGFVRGQRLYPAHYALLYFTKGKPRTFSRPKIAPAICRHCGELVKDYGGYRAIVEEKGINLSDIWDDLSPVRHANRKHRKANELNPVLVERVLQMSGVRSGMFVDPFAGSGTTIVAAKRHSMRFAACDMQRANTRLIIERLNQ